MLRIFYHREALQFSVSGLHAPRYLQARLSQDILNMRVGELTNAAALSSQGKLQALFHVLRLAERDFKLFCLGGEAEEIKTQLLQFRVTEQVDVEVVKGSLLRMIGSIEEALPQLTQCSIAGGIALAEDSVIALRRRELGKDWCDIFGSHDDLKNLVNESFDILEEQQLFAEKVLRNAPEFPSEIKQGQLLLEAPQLHAVSFKKGCYVGQEVNEKIDSHGKAPKIIVPFECSQEETNSELILEGSKIGDVIRSVPYQGKVVGFARLKNIQQLSTLPILWGDGVISLLDQSTK